MRVFGKSHNIPNSVKAICLVSFFINMSTLMIFSFFGLYLHRSLKVNLAKIGVLDGTVEACSFLMKLFSGYLSDLLCNRKILFLLGATLLLLSKPLEAIGRSFAPLFCAKVLERLGNGIQSTPRDALVSDWAPKEVRTSCFGLRQGMAAIGSLCGTVIAALLYKALKDFQSVFWFACIPAAISVLIIIFCVKNKINSIQKTNYKCNIKFRESIRFREITKFSKKYWILLSIAATYNCAKVSETFILLNMTKAYDLSIIIAPLILAICYISNSLTAILTGTISDKGKDLTKILMFGLGMFITSDLLFIYGSNIPVLSLIALLCFGSYIGVSQSIFVSKVSEVSPVGLTGTGLGIYNLVCALSLLAGGTVLGRIADTFGFSHTFAVSAILASIAFLVLYISDLKKKEK